MPNRLATETSPYLLQHADNPVDWYPWGGEALARARAENRPILLSIGYSACHWCHVMAHESFEDAEIARLMNERYVSIKVDREERPDLDQIYQTAHSILTRRPGGWPLTMFLTPDQTPFFAGTYFPKTPRHGLPGFADLLVRVADAYGQQGPAIAEQNARLKEALAGIHPERAAAVRLSAEPIRAALAGLERTFDPVEGGFGRAPKFPHPTDIELCLRRHAQTGDTDALGMATLTLTKMAEGGIFDHLGGGFCRYSVDGEWTIPHFEKMLYDNAQLLPLYADGWRITADPLFAETAKATAQWVMTEMQSDDGGYFSSVDADSEGAEGKFYLWTPDEVRALLTEDEYVVAAAYFGLDADPNFEGQAWHLRVRTQLPAIAARTGATLESVRGRLESARAKLLAQRAGRVPPGRDEKILTSWNALMIGGMARAGRALGEPQWVASARRALDFARSTLWTGGRFLATSKDGRAHLAAYLDDYAYALAALLEMLQSDFRVEDWVWAMEVADALLRHFEDARDGGFFFTAHDHEQLIHRTKVGHDNATPNGNGVAARALLELGHLAGEVRFLEAAQRALELFAPQYADHPGGFSSLLFALDEWLVPPTTVILRGDTVEATRWARSLEADYRPATLVLTPGSIPVPLPLAKPGASSTGPSQAWVCLGPQCLPALGDLESVRQTLAAQRRP